LASPRCLSLTPSRLEGASALDKFRLGSRVYDFQKDGRAHYGMLPDFVQALSEHVDLQPKPALDALYHSAEDIVEM
jgi:hypothetical protein